MILLHDDSNEILNYSTSLLFWYQDIFTDKEIWKDIVLGGIVTKQPTKTLKLTACTTHPKLNMWQKLKYQYTIERCCCVFFVPNFHRNMNFKLSTFGILWFILSSAVLCELEPVRDNETKILSKDPLGVRYQILIPNYYFCLHWSGV